MSGIDSFLLTSLAVKRGIMTEDKAVLGRFAMEYVRACQKVMDALNAALECANLAVGGRGLAEDPTVDPGSREHYADAAKRHEAQFGPLYRDFEESRTLAKQAAARLIAACPESDPELALATYLLEVEPKLLNMLGSAIVYLRTPFGSTARAFAKAVEQANAAMASEPFPNEPGFRGLIYRDQEGKPMATWADLVSYVRSNFEIAKEGDGILAIDQRLPSGRSQIIFLQRVIMAGEWVKISSRIGQVEGVNLDAVLREVGQMAAGGLSIESGYLMLRTFAPIETMQHTEFMKQFGLIADAADLLEWKFTGRDEL
jgi:hypothetical protein